MTVNRPDMATVSSRPDLRRRRGRRRVGAAATPRRPLFAGRDEWDWDRVKELAETGIGRCSSRRWLALAYLFVGMLTGFVFFGSRWSLGGHVRSAVRRRRLPAGRRCSSGSSRRSPASNASWRRSSATDIPARAVTPIKGIGLRAVLDPERWRQVGFLAAQRRCSGSLLFAAGSFAYSFVLRVIFDNEAFVGFSLFSLQPVRRADRAGDRRRSRSAARRGWRCWSPGSRCRSTSWFLAPDRLAAAERRVSTLSAQRQDILDAVASERRRIERNLHDGVQQQLVAIGLDLGMAEHHLDADPDRARELIVSAREKVQGSIGELRQLGRGLHPAILEDRGIDAALSAVVANSPIPISVHVDPDLDLSTDVAETIYFVVNEAIANVMKHAKAKVASVHVMRWATTCASPSTTTASAGSTRRREPVSPASAPASTPSTASFAVTSPDGGPTTLTVEIPRRRVRHRSDGVRHERAADPHDRRRRLGAAPRRRRAAADRLRVRRRRRRRRRRRLARRRHRVRPDLCVVDVRMPPTHTDEGLRAAIEIRDVPPRRRRAGAVAVRRGALRRRTARPATSPGSATC